MTDRRTKAQLVNVLKYQAGVIDSKNEEIKALKQCVILMSKHIEIKNTELNPQLVFGLLGPKSEEEE